MKVTRPVCRLSTVNCDQKLEMWDFFSDEFGHNNYTVSETGYAVAAAEVIKVKGSKTGTEAGSGRRRRRVKRKEVFRGNTLSLQRPASAGLQGEHFGLPSEDKAPLCVSSGRLTASDRPVLTRPSGSDVFKIEIYGAALFPPRRSRRVSPPFMLHS